VAASLRHRGSTRMRKSSASPLENSFRRSVRSSNSKQSGASLAADSEPASPPVPDSVVVCSPVWSNTSSDSSQESKKLLLSEKEEAKKWWLEKVAKERQMMQMRKSFLQVKWIVRVSKFSIIFKSDVKFSMISESALTVARQPMAQWARWSRV